MASENSPLAGASAFQPFLNVRGDVFFRPEAREVHPGPHESDDQRPAAPTASRTHWVAIGA